MAKRFGAIVPKQRDFVRTEMLNPQRTTWGSSASSVEKKSNFKPSGEQLPSLEHPGGSSRSHKQGGETR